MFCEIVCKFVDDYNIGCVIVCFFIGEIVEIFEWIGNCCDYLVLLFEFMFLDWLKNGGCKVYVIGKIVDIFVY